MAEIDKQTASRRLIASAVKGAFWEDDPLGLHVRVLAAYDLIREYADTKKIALTWDLRDFIVKGRFKEFIGYFKKPYNFLKHANIDADAKLDVTNLEEINDFCLLLVARMHYDCFKEWAPHQAMFVGYIAMAYPDLLNEGPFKDQITEKLKTYKPGNRSEWMDLFRHIYDENGLSKLERG